MNRRLVSVLFAGFSMIVATGAAFALGNSVSTTPPPAFVQSSEIRSGGADDPATHDAGDDRRSVDRRSATTATTGTAGTTARSGKATTPTAPKNTVTTTDDHGSGGHGADDPATHDLGDDPATHDLGDDHGGLRDDSTTSPSTPSTTITTAASGNDDPAGHEAGDDGGHRRRGRDG